MFHFRNALLLTLAATFAARAAFACDPLDPFCNPPPADPCSTYASGTTDYNNCRYSLPQCPNLTGPVLQACLAHAVAVAAGSTMTSTSTATGTAVNRANNWTATKLNNDLFQNEASNKNQQGNYNVQMNGTAVQVSENVGSGLFLNQNDSYNAQNSVLTGCASTNLSGRTDSLCIGNPNDPECTGLSGSLTNAATCVSPGPNDPTTGQPTCLQYGSNGYSVDEWLVFGQQYYTSLSACFAVGDAPDTTGTNSDPNKIVSRANRLLGINDFAAPPEITAKNAITPTAASTVTGSTSASKITSGGKTQKVPLWQSVVDKINDGAAALGYERGEMVKRSASGQPFVEAFSESPFAASWI